MSKPPIMDVVALWFEVVLKRRRGNAVVEVAKVKASLELIAIVVVAGARYDTVILDADEEAMVITFESRSAPPARANLYDEGVPPSGRKREPGVVVPIPTYPPFVITN